MVRQRWRQPVPLLNPERDMNDFQQNAAINDLRIEAEGSLDSFKTIADRLERERNRNNVQAARIKALTVLCENLVDRLTVSGAVKADELANELAGLREASEP